MMVARKQAGCEAELQNLYLMEYEYVTLVNDTFRVQQDATISTTSTCTENYMQAHRLGAMPFWARLHFSVLTIFTSILGGLCQERRYLEVGVPEGLSITLLGQRFRTTPCDRHMDLVGGLEG